MKRKLKQYQVFDKKIWYREGLKEDGSDLDGIKEVLERRCYRRTRDGFDVEKGERWLDLGGNIGAFAVYCDIRGAKHVESYEPDAENFSILTKNSRYEATCAAVSDSKKKTLSFFSSPNPDNRYRGTIGAHPARYVEEQKVKNIWAGELRKETFDGVKMDIEGSEGPIIDEWLLPKCEKLVMEYHTSRDPSAENLNRRWKILYEHFTNVWIPSALFNLIETGEKVPRYDQLIFCWGAK